MEQKWIPVEERLPDDFATVNVTWINRSPEPYYKPAPPEPHWKDRMMNTFLGGR